MFEEFQPTGNRGDQIRQVVALCAKMLESGAAFDADEVHSRFHQLMPDLKSELQELLVARARQGVAAELDDTRDRSTHASDGENQNAVDNRVARRASAGVRSFGDYEILNEINKGGMGVVYRARQVSLNRIVALKMIRAGEFADQEQIQRFYVEAEAAANLDHPNIVPLYEVGQNNGQHYFSMAYVDGQSLAEVLREQLPPQRTAAQYVQTASEAIHYAHELGVLHRDIKPGNVLIDTAGLVRVTDFGLAKRIGSDSDLTRESQVLGTPEYMSPEQAKGENDQLAPASDVYALGALLYALLTGRPPFRADNWMATLRQACEKEPVSPREINPAIDRDLETITLKCLEKEPTQRYQSAAALAAELGRFLRGEEIEARPLGRLAKTWRWSKRNPVVAALSLGIAVVMLVSTVISSLLAAWAVSEARTARRQSKLAEHRFAQAHELATAFIVDVDDDLRDLIGTTQVRKQIVEMGAAYLDRLAKDSGDDITLQRDRALGYEKLGDILGHPTRANLGDARGAFKLYQKSLLIRQHLASLPESSTQIERDLSSSYLKLGDIHRTLGDPHRANENYQKCHDIRQGLASRPDATAGDLAALADCMSARGLASEEKGQVKDAREYFEAALALRKKVAALHRRLAKHAEALFSSHLGLARFHILQGEFEDADEHLRHAESLAQRRADENPNSYPAKRATLLIQHGRGDYFFHLGENAQAASRYTVGLELAQDLAEEDRHSVQARRDLASAYSRVGDCRAKMGEPEAAEVEFRSALSIRADLARQHPDNAKLQRELSDAHTKVGEALLATTGGGQESHEQFQQALEALETRAAGAMPNAQQRSRIWFNIAEAHRALLENETPSEETSRHTREAVAAYQKALAFLNEGDVSMRGSDQSMTSLIRMRIASARDQLEAHTSAERSASPLFKRELPLDQASSELAGEAAQGTSSWSPGESAVRLGEVTALTNATDALVRVTAAIESSLAENDTHVVWLMDQSATLAPLRIMVHDQLDRLYEQVGLPGPVGGAQPRGDDTLLSSVVAFGKNATLRTEHPTSNVAQLKAAIAGIEVDVAGVENVFTTIALVTKMFRPESSAEQSDRESTPKLMIVVLSDEAGDDLQQLENAVALCRRHAVPVYVIGVPAPFGRRQAIAKWVDPDPRYDQSPQWGAMTMGPESLMLERLHLHFSAQDNVSDVIDSGFGPFALSRLCYQTGGGYFSVHPNRNTRRQVTRREISAYSAHFSRFFDPGLMRKYMPDYVSSEQYRRHLLLNKCREALVRSAAASMMSPLASPPTRFVRRSEASFVNSLSNAQKSAAVFEPRVARIAETLEIGEGDRSREELPRWQAGYDLAMGRVLAVQTRIRSYQLLLARARRGYEFRDRNNTLVLQPSDDGVADRSFDALAARARKYLRRVVEEHPGTPWAFLAQRELDGKLSWQWREDFVDLAPRGSPNGRPMPPNDAKRPLKRPPARRKPPRF